MAIFKHNVEEPIITVCIQPLETGNVTIIAYTAPDASPVGVTVTNVSPGVVILQWLPPPDDKHNGDITGYVIRIVNLEQLIEAEEMEVDDVTSKIISDLKTSHAYNFSVSAKNIAGLGPFSHSSSILTLHGGKFSTPDYPTLF